MCRLFIATLSLVLLVSAISCAEQNRDRSERAETPEGDALDQRVAQAFKARCTVCHDDRQGSPAGDVDFLLDFVRLVDPDNRYIDAASPSESYLREIITAGSMPKQNWRDGIQWGGPLTDTEKNDILMWIDRGGPGDLYRRQAAKAAALAARDDIPEKQIVEFIFADLKALKGDELANARYLTLTNLHNMDSVSGDALERYRQAIVKLLNSLSRSRIVLRTDVSDTDRRVKSVDQERTIFRFDLRDIGWQAGDWDRVLQHYPYALIRDDGAAQAVYKLTTSDFPYVRADWFVFATAQPPLYHELVGIPQQLSVLETRLGVNRLDDIRNFRVARAGLPADSNVSRNNRLLERLTGRDGYYHISYDFARNDAAANFFENPLGPVDAFKDTEFAFRHDGGEVIYRLPNGFQAYALVKADGGRLSIAPSAIVTDPSMPGGVIINGISCMSCHYDGMKPENPQLAASLDKVRLLTLQNFARFDVSDRNRIAKLYPEHVAFDALLRADRNSFRAALVSAGITQTGANEPVRELFNRFADNLHLEAAAADFGIAEAAFTDLLDREGPTRELGKRFAFGGVQRQLYVQEFQKIARLTGLGQTRGFKPLALPYFGEDPDAPAGAAVAVNPEPRVDILDADNLNGRLKITVGSVDGRTDFKNQETIPVAMKATEDCYVTVFGINPDDTVELLVPNKWHRAPVLLHAGRTMYFTGENTGFEFFADAPHGTTLLRVIATKRPLAIAGADANSLATQESFLLLGTAKSLRNGKGIGVRLGPQSAVAPITPVTEPQAPSDIELSRQFLPDEWATARWEFTTHP